MKTGFVQRAVEQVSHVEIVRPVLHIGQIERGALYFEHTQDVGPLTIRNLASHAVPQQFVENDIFSRGQDKPCFNGAFLRQQGVFGLCPAKGRLVGSCLRTNTLSIVSR